MIIIYLKSDETIHILNEVLHRIFIKITIILLSFSIIRMLFKTIYHNYNFL